MKGVSADSPAIQADLRTIFEQRPQSSLSSPELRKREEELIKGALKAVEQDTALEKRKLEADLETARKAAAQMQQQLDALRVAEHAGKKGVRKPQHKHKFQVLSLDRSYVWHQVRAFHLQSPFLTLAASLPERISTNLSSL